MVYDAFNAAYFDWSVEFTRGSPARAADTAADTSRFANASTINNYLF